MKHTERVASSLMLRNGLFVIFEKVLYPRTNGCMIFGEFSVTKSIDLSNLKDTVIGGTNFESRNVHL